MFQASLYFTYLVGRLRVLRDEHFDLGHADAEVAVRELVWDVEAERSELAPLQRHGVEEAEGEEEHLECVGLVWKRGEISLRLGEEMRVFLGVERALGEHQL